MIIRSDEYITNPLVSCGIIVYNQKQWIEQCIDGMLNQKCDFDFNIVVADDCSTDGTRALLESYQQRFPEKIKLVLNDKNGGIAANWVSCCKAMEGGVYVSFCDGDDYWSNFQKLQLQVNYLRTHPECVAVSTDYDTVNEDGMNLKKNVRKASPPLTGMVQQDLWGPGKSINAWCTFMFRKDVMDKNMPYDTFIEKKFPFQDWPAAVVMAAYGEFHYIEESTCLVRIASGSDSHAVDLQKFIMRQTKCRAMNIALNDIYPYLRLDSEEDWNRYFAGTLIGLCVRNNDFNNAKKYALQHGVKNLCYWCCQNRLSFQMFRLLKLLYNYRSNI